MAEAKKIDIAVPPPFKVSLTLSSEEAETLLSVCGVIGVNGRRGEHTYSIYQALSNLGIKSLGRSIFVKDYSSLHFE